jgi:hypothetical protein
MRDPRHPQKSSKRTMRQIRFCATSPQPETLNMATPRNKTADKLKRAAAGLAQIRRECIAIVALDTKGNPGVLVFGCPNGICERCDDVRSRIPHAPVLPSPTLKPAPIVKPLADAW